MTYPDLTLCLLNYKRPWYSLIALNQMKQIRYAGCIKFHIADGGSPKEHIHYMLKVLEGYKVTVSVTSNLGDMMNSCAHNSGDVWVVSVDDYAVRRSFDITPDVRLLLEHPEIGCVRFSRLAFWGNGGNSEPGTRADLIECGGMHWWRIDKARTTDVYSCNIGFHLYHRRFWDVYGDIQSIAPDRPGDAELAGRNRYNDNPNLLTIAVPMRFPQDSVDTQEFIWHMGMWRTDEYTRHSTTGRL